MSLDVFQQVLRLSLVSNLVSDFKGTQTSLQKELQCRVTSALGTIPGWQLVWGPVVWKNKPEEAETGPDNAWYVAFHPNLRFEDGSVHPTYVVAVAGTPLESEYVWINQNFAVNSVADFRVWVASGIQNPPQVVPAKDIVPGTPYIAKGTADGVHLLLTIPAPEGAEAAGTTLLDFISSVDQSFPPRFITTGHSLGGALSPSLALALVTAGVVPVDSTLTYPSAGPSPGNRGFTELFTQTFPARKPAGASSYQGWNLNLVNTLDIVPQAWAVHRDMSPQQNLGNIPPIYGLPVAPFVRGITVVFAVHTLRSGVLYFPLPSQYFTGPPPPSPPTSVGEFLQLVGPQHLDAYFVEAGIPISAPEGVSGSGLGRKTGDEIRFNYPVIAGFEWAREHPEEAKKEIEKDEGSEEGRTVLKDWN